MTKVIKGSFKAAIKKHILPICVFLFFIVLVLSLYIVEQIKAKEIIENKVFTIGQITGYKNPHRPIATAILLYTYTADGVTYKDLNSGQEISYKNYKYFEGKYFFVIYSKINPHKNRILITPNAYKAFGYQYPDSLEWVKDYLYF